MLTSPSPSPRGIIPELHPGWAVVEPPNLLWVTPVGDVTLAQAVALYAFFETFACGPGSMYVLQDLSHVQGFKPEVRRFCASDERSALLAGIANYGAPLHIRVLMNMVARASRLLRGAFPYIAFFATETEARRWLDAQRDHR